MDALLGNCAKLGKGGGGTSFHGGGRKGKSHRFVDDVTEKQSRRSVVKNVLCGKD